MGCVVGLIVSSFFFTDDYIVYNTKMGIMEKFLTAHGGRQKLFQKDKENKSKNYLLILLMYYNSIY